MCNSPCFFLNTLILRYSQNETAACTKLTSVIIVTLDSTQYTFQFGVCFNILCVRKIVQYSITKNIYKYTNYTVVAAAPRGSGWPSGLRRCVQVAVSSGGVGSNPTSDSSLLGLRLAGEWPSSGFNSRASPVQYIYQLPGCRS